MTDTNKIVPPYKADGYKKTGSYSDEDDADYQIFEQLIDMGSTLTNPRHTIHYFYFPTEAGSLLAGEELKASGFNIECGEPFGEEPVTRRWAVKADRTQVIDPQ